MHLPKKVHLGDNVSHFFFKAKKKKEWTALKRMRLGRYVAFCALSPSLSCCIFWGPRVTLGVYVSLFFHSQEPFQWCLFWPWAAASRVAFTMAYTKKSSERHGYLAITAEPIKKSVVHTACIGGILRAQTVHCRIFIVFRRVVALFCSHLFPPI